jgi:hypothetical protein
MMQEYDEKVKEKAIEIFEIVELAQRVEQVNTY